MGRPGARRFLAFCHFTDDNTGVDVSAGLEGPAGFVCSKDPVGSKTLQDRMDRWNWLVNNQNPFCLCTVQILVQAFLSNSALAVHNTLFMKAAQATFAFLQENALWLQYHRPTDLL